MKRAHATVGLVLALGLLAWACGGGTTTEGGDGGGATGAGDAGGGVELGMLDVSFDPATISGPAGSELTVRLANEGEGPHTFTIEDQGVDVELEPGDSGEATVTVPESGAVEFICRFHEQAGMVGTLEAV